MWSNPSHWILELTKKTAPLKLRQHFSVVYYACLALSMKLEIQSNAFLSSRIASLVGPTRPANLTLQFLACNTSPVSIMQVSLVTKVLLYIFEHLSSSLGQYSRCGKYCLFRAFRLSSVFVCDIRYKESSHSAKNERLASSHISIFLYYTKRIDRFRWNC